GCHANWVEHFWQDFGGVLDRFAPGIRIVTTTDTYRNPEMQALVRDLASRAEEVRATVNKYRTRHPYPPGWIPFEAFCEKCGTIGVSPGSVRFTNTLLLWPTTLLAALRGLLAVARGWRRGATQIGRAGAWFSVAFPTKPASALVAATTRPPLWLVTPAGSRPP